MQGEDSRACVHLGRSLARSGSLLEQSQAARWYTIAAARDHPVVYIHVYMLSLSLHSCISTSLLCVLARIFRSLVIF